MKHLLLTLLLALPLTALATDYFEEEYTSMCFLATPNGPGCVHFKIMYLDQATGANGYLMKTSDYPNGPWLYMKEDGRSWKRPNGPSPSTRNGTTSATRPW